MDFSNLTNLRELLAAGGPVLILLLLLSVYSISVILERYFKLRSAISFSRKLISYSRHPLRSENYQKVEEACKKDVVKNTPAAHLPIWCRNATVRKSNLKNWLIILLIGKFPNCSAV